MSAPSSADAERAVAEEKPAIVAALICYLIWGLLPLFFMAAARLGATAWEIVAERSFWSLFWALGLVRLSGQWTQAPAVLHRPRVLMWLAASALLIAVNWLIFVWAVNHGDALDASLGYFINPLLNVVVGAVLFRERLSRPAAVAVGLAALGVAIQTVAVGRPPLVALALAASFCGYGVIRKRVPVDAQTGLMVECLILAPFGLAYMVWAQRTGVGHLGHTAGVTVMLLLSGPVTVAPLALFAWAARRMPLSTLGFLQFLSPTLQFAIGLATGETLTPLRAGSFVLIWAGVAVFVWGAWRAHRAAR